MSKIIHTDNRSVHIHTQHTELVSKNVTSTALSTKKRKKSARRILKHVLKEQRRYAKQNNLRAVAITLTYKTNGKFGSKHISVFLDSIRRALKRKGYSLPYVWTLESEGRLHYHLMLWLPREYKLDLHKLNKWWPWGSNWVENCQSPSAWGCYLSKCESISKLPRGARLFGYGGLDEEGKAAVILAKLPIWLRALLPNTILVRKITGGGWINMETGEWYQSPYIWTPFGIILREKAYDLHKFL